VIEGSKFQIYITPVDDVVIKCFPFSDRHIPVINSPQVALQRTLPDFASKMVSCLAVLDDIAISQLSSKNTFIWSGLTFNFGSGCFSQIMSKFNVSLMLKFLSSPVRIKELWLSKVLAISIENILFLTFLEMTCLKGS
jgi:hypothetical protein